MRQVPETFDYLIIGSGRLARHLSFYFSSLNLSFKQWNRKENSSTELSILLSKAKYSLLCINDDDIFNFFLHHENHPTQFIHFSGALNIKNILGFHPLMTFGDNFFPISFYPQIPFISSEAQETFHKVFPQLKNPFAHISAENKALYHSLCVLSGNGTTLIWDLIFKQFEDLGLTRETLKPYLKQVTENLITDSKGRWTGPWYRNDIETTRKHLHELKHTSLQGLYGELFELSHEIGENQ